MHAQFNNYQAIVVSDVIRTYLVFLYKCGEVQWSALGRNRAAVVGYNAEGKYFSNHPLSGYAAIGDDVSCTSGHDLGKKRKKRSEHDGDGGGEVPTKEDLAKAVKECDDATKFSRLLRGSLTVEKLAQMLYPCPCTRSQAILDHGRFSPQKDMPQCYISTNPIDVMGLPLEKISLTQQCCYSINNDG